MKSIRSNQVAVCGALLAASTSWSVSAGAVSAVGFNSFGQATVPPQIRSWIAMAGGREFSLGLRQDGQVVGWGLADGNQSKPSVGVTNVVLLSAGIYHAYALCAGGDVAGWGFNGGGMLNTPSDLRQAISVAAGGYHSVAVRRDGTVVCWGFSGNGRTHPPESLRDVVAVDAGRDFSVALKSDGTVTAWGLNEFGQTDVPPELRDVTLISAGEAHTLALRSNGTVVGWGKNDLGQATIPANLTQVVAISAGDRHSLALRQDGTVVAWGDNSKGQLDVPKSGARGIAAGGYHSLVQTEAGPRVTQSPRGQSLLAGSNTKFTVAAVGSGLSYQWSLNGSDIPGATGSSLALERVGGPHAGIYTVNISDAAGNVAKANAPLIVRGRLKAQGVQRLSSGRTRITFSDELGGAMSPAKASRYGVQVSQNLQEWRAVETTVQVVNGALQVEAAEANGLSQQFYRATEK